MSLSSMLRRARPMVERALRDLSPPYTLFFSISDAKQRAQVRHTHAKDFPSAWQTLTEITHRAAKSSKIEPCWLRVDWVTRRSTMTLAGLHELLQDTKRSYFRYGLALDVDCKFAFLEQELNGNAMLHGGDKIEHGFLNEKNFTSYFKKRFNQQEDLDFSDERSIVLLTTAGLFCEKELEPLCLYESGLNTGRRVIEELDSQNATKIIESSSHYLAGQVKPSGHFHYGWHACFDQEIINDKNLCHASSICAMVEAWEVTKEYSLLEAIEEALKYLTSKLIQITFPNTSEVAAFWVEQHSEIDLASNAASLLALVKYSEALQCRTYADLMEQLARGIEFLQNLDTGQLPLVLEFSSFTIKQQPASNNPLGKAAFALICLYSWDKNPRWLTLVEKSLDHFIATEHWRAHDHWVSHCVNLLTIYRPKEKYYQFGIRNFVSILDFVEKHITASPRLLELMVAAAKMISDLSTQEAYQYLLDQIDLEHFYRALHGRANHLLNGYFWPELAMFFKNPARVTGSFFTRHENFRVRLDEVSHCLSSLIAYRKYLLSQAPKKTGATANLYHSKIITDGQATASSVAQDRPVIAWGGDVNLGRRQHYRTAQLGIEQVLGHVPAMNNADLSVINLECVIATSGEQGIPKGEASPCYYRARPEMLSILINAGIDIACTANNHSGDYGPAALMEQGQWLDCTGIGHSGSGRNLEEALSPVIRPAGNINVAIFSLDATQPRYAAGPTHPGCAHLPLSVPELWYDTLRPLITAARKKAQVVLVAVHWEANHKAQPCPQQVIAAHKIIEAGADGILGSGSYNLKGIEIYQQRPIIHGAGDLLFDCIRESVSDSGVFRLHLSTSGIEQITFAPVEAGFGYSKQLYGEAAKAHCKRFSQICLSLGTQLHLCEDGTANLKLTPPSRLAGKLSISRKTTYRQEKILAKRPINPQWQVPSVPVDAQIPPQKIGPLVLLGVKLTPRELISRQMLWVESFWKIESKLSEDFRLDFRAIPTLQSSMPCWGTSMDHDPCDWQLPTSHWEPNTIYRDFFGLRAPASRDLSDAELHLYVGLISNKTKIKPIPIPGVMSKLSLTPQREYQKSKIPVYRTKFPDIIYDHLPGQTWNAEQLATISGGTWLEPPPKDKEWFVSSVVSDSGLIEASSEPVLFVAHTNLDRSYHAPIPKVSAKFWDSHKKLPSFADRIAGAIVSRPIPGLPKGLPVLKVDDPLKTIIELGFAARERFDGEVIAITGTSEGLPIRNMITHTLGPKDKVLTNSGADNSCIAAPCVLASLNKDHEAAIIEVTQSALSMKPGPITHRIKPTISLITEIDLPSTNQMATSVADMAKLCSRIFEGLTGPAIAIVGEHLQCFDYIFKKAKKHARRVILFGESTNAEVRINKTCANDNDDSVSLQLPNRELEISLPNSSNEVLYRIAAVISIIYAMNGNIEEAASKLQKINLNAKPKQQATISPPQYINWI
ncbi:CapA family protein [Microbulbifer sp. ANSA002]|uniref:CapA family protein n=1 Tax=unclassified Microbulbifer TaxID=2619833 RepID=UPI00404244C8